MRKLAILPLLILALIHTSMAHLAGGEDRIAGGYLVDFGFSPANITSQNSSFINFNLLENSTLRMANITSVWVRISDDKNVVFAGTFKPVNGNFGFLFTFPAGGKYEILARFYNDSKVLTEQKYNLNVTGETGDPFFETTLAIIAVLAFFAIFLNARRK
ncbi:MAG: hypothetical protein EPN86_00450 [Nanoarchaeota archaeon]|nr:MAG: hypothetical protein EPN86_00450 [Nanoarchaeota archaeon]